MIPTVCNAQTVPQIVQFVLMDLSLSTMCVSVLMAHMKVLMVLSVSDVIKDVLFAVKQEFVTFVLVATNKTMASVLSTVPLALTMQEINANNVQIIAVSALKLLIVNYVTVAISYLQAHAFLNVPLRPMFQVSSVWLVDLHALLVLSIPILAHHVKMDTFIAMANVCRTVPLVNSMMALLVCLAVQHVSVANTQLLNAHLVRPISI